MSFIDKAGGVHDSEHSKGMANEGLGFNKDGSSKSNAADPAGMIPAVGMLFKLAALIPSLIAKLVGFIIGGLLKLGIVGRVVLTALFAVCVIIILAFPLQPFVSGTNEAVPFALEVVFDVVLLALAAFASIWFFTKHYHVLKALPVLELSHHTTVCGTIVFWGIIAMGIIAQIFGLHTGVAILVPFVVSWIVWLKLTEEKVVHMLIVVGVAVALCIVEAVGFSMAKAHREAEYAKKIEANPILAMDTPFEATITANVRATEIVTYEVNEAEIAGPITIPAGTKITIFRFRSDGDDGVSKAYFKYNEKRTYFIENLSVIKPLE